jgi:uncharacterized protein (DUF1778 family)
MTDPHATADRRWFRLPARAWATFQNHLDRPPVFKPRLAELLTPSHEPPPLDDHHSRIGTAA